MLKQLELSNDQRSLVMLHEIEYQLTVMKQYLSVEHTAAYLILLNKYGSIADREYVLQRYRDAWGETLSLKE